MTEMRVASGGPEKIETHSVERLQFVRFGTTTEQEISISHRETCDGDLIDFQYQVTLGSAPRSVQGVVEGQALKFQVTTSGKTVSRKLPWPKENRGLFAVQRSLRSKPMIVGEQRALRGLLPVFNQVAQIELEAVAMEPTELLTETRVLLRIDVTTTLSQAKPFRSQMWTDQAGEMRKSRVVQLGQETFRTTSQIAQQREEGTAFDLSRMGLVPLLEPWPDPHESTRVEYEVTWRGGNPSELFASGATQSVESLTEHQSRIVVGVVPSDQHGNGVRQTEGPTSEDLQPSGLIDSRDPAVVAMAHQITADGLAPRDVVIALEQTVFRNVSKHDFTQVFATASEVAVTRRGDCTEHAVLLAGLCRARGIPARAVVGLIYHPSEHGFLYHMWNEVWVDDSWMAVDATRGEGGISAAHLKIGDTSLDDMSAYGGLLSVIPAFGQLKIRVVRVE